jgi:hypothetical protein
MGRRLTAVLALFVSAWPAVSLARFIAPRIVDVPLWDQWQLVPVLDHYFNGTLRLGELWAQHNEHRLLFPRLIMLALAVASRWNIAWEIWTTYAFAVGIFAVLSWHVWRASGTIAWEAPLLALIVFSVAQDQNWLWGWQLCVPLSVLGVTGSLLLLCATPLGWRRVLGALAAATVASYSFSNSILVWPIGLGVRIGRRGWAIADRDIARRA